MKKSPQRDLVRRSLASLPVGEWRIGIVCSSFYKEEMDVMVKAATETLIELGVSEENISLHGVPGSFEIPLIGAALAERGAVHALIGLGIIVEGATHHAELVARECARGMMDVQTKYRTPFAFEVLYVGDLADANERLSKGEGAALAALLSLAALRNAA